MTVTKLEFNIQVVNSSQCQLCANQNAHKLLQLDTLFQELKSLNLPDLTIQDKTVLFLHKHHNNIVESLGKLFSDGKFVTEKLLKPESRSCKISVNICQLPIEVVFALAHEWKPVPEEKVEKRPIWNKLRPFQRLSVQKALHKRCQGRMILCDEMGLGKSIQALACVDHVKSGWPAVIVCPASNRQTWVSECQDHLGFKDSQILVGKSSKSLEKLSNDHKVIILSYQLIDKLETYMDKVSFWPNTIIVDESHNIKNFKAKKTQCLIKLIPKITYRFLLSGTTMTRAKEFFGQLNALHPDMFPYFTKYAERYCLPTISFLTKRRRIINYDRSTRLVELHAILSNTFMMRRTKAQVLSELPPKIRTRFVLNQKAKIKSDKYLDAVHKYVGQKAESIMTDFLFEYELPTKDIWFFYHADMKVELVKWLLGNNISHVVADGKVSLYHSGKKGTLYETLERDDIVKIFQKGERPCQVALLSLLCFNSGLTLTSSSNIVCFELHADAIIHIQAEDRIHRIGQSADRVMITYIIQPNSLDEKIWSILCSKYENLTQVLDGESKNLNL
jgi:SWI/SNF-related matrix-associated actin-dependent regulator 1 of chromatin subfamily A